MLPLTTREDSPKSIPSLLLHMLFRPRSPRRQRCYSAPGHLGGQKAKSCCTCRQIGFRFLHSTTVPELCTHKAGGRKRAMPGLPRERLARKTAEKRPTGEFESGRESATLQQPFAMASTMNLQVVAGFCSGLEPLSGSGGNFTLGYKTSCPTACATHTPCSHKFM